MKAKLYRFPHELRFRFSVTKPTFYKVPTTGHTSLTSELWRIETVLGGTTLPKQGSEFHSRQDHFQTIVVQKSLRPLD
jgi:hypothetical protein